MQTFPFGPSEMIQYALQRDSLVRVEVSAARSGGKGQRRTHLIDGRSDGSFGPWLEVQSGGGSVQTFPRHVDMDRDHETHGTQ